MKSKSEKLAEGILDKLKDLIKSKAVLYLVVETCVHQAFERELCDEAELRKMVDKAIDSYKKKAIDTR